MMTLRQLAAEPPTIPTRTGWYLADLGEAKGKYALYTRQSPQKLKVLREHALIESAVSSNRIEGVEVDKSRVATFRVADLQADCAGVGVDLLRQILARLQKEKKSDPWALAGAQNGKRPKLRINSKTRY